MLRRLRLLREWSHEKVNQVIPRCVSALCGASMQKGNIKGRSSDTSPCLIKRGFLAEVAISLGTIGVMGALRLKAFE